MPTRNNTRATLTTSCSWEVRHVSCRPFCVRFDVFQTEHYLCEWQCTSVNEQNQVNNGMNFIYLKQYFSPFLTFLKLKTAKNKSSALLSCRQPGSSVAACPYSVTPVPGTRPARAESVPPPFTKQS